MARVEKTVFISYRRKDISWALAVYQYLTSKNYDVFFDFTSLSSGDFEQVIISNIRARAHFVLILTPTALDRCDEPGDWLRREIETAIAEKRNIVPLFFDGFKFNLPSVVEKLTGGLTALPRYNGLEIPPGYFLEAMQRLSDRYLNASLVGVIHPLSMEENQVVREEQSAVEAAVVRNWESIKELFKPAEESGEGTSPKASLLNLRLYGMGAGVLALLVAVILGVRSLLPLNSGIAPTMTSLVVPTATSVAVSVIPDVTATMRRPTSTSTMEPTITITPSPTSSNMVSTADGMTMLYVPAGQFTMGLDNDKYETDNPAHKITLSDYWIDQTEVTNAMYQKCVDAQACATPYSVASGSIKPYYGNSNYAGFPVIHIPWQEASNYCEWVGRRLPSEAQWEKAARGSTDERIYPWGDDDPFRDLSNFGGLVGNTTAVNEQSDGKSPYGALNMAGNVWEWVSDLYDPDYYNKSLSKDPEGPVIGDKHVMRGGSWKDFPSTIRVVHRYADYPLYASSILGFRCSYPPKK